MANTESITQEYLRSILNYDPQTGIFTWRIKKGQRGLIGLSAGCLKNNGYIEIKIDGITYKAHRLAYLYVYGIFPDEVDHVDFHGPRSDNRILNLRSASHSSNQHNRSKYKTNKSGYKGVYWDSQYEKWRAGIRLNGKLYNLGRFDIPEAAHAAYCEAAHRLHGDFARTE